MKIILYIPLFVYFTVDIMLRLYIHRLMPNGIFIISYNIYYVPATKLCNKRRIFSQNIEKNNKGILYLHFFTMQFS